MIYLATPYSHPDKEVMHARFQQACAIAAKLMASGLIVFSPIAHTHPIAVAGDLPRGWEFWHRYDHEFIAASEKVLVVKMNGWQDSKGIAGEIAIAAELGKPVEYMDIE